MNKKIKYKIFITIISSLMLIGCTSKEQSITSYSSMTVAQVTSELFAEDLIIATMSKYEQELVTELTEFFLSKTSINIQQNNVIVTTIDVDKISEYIVIDTTELNVVSIFECIKKSELPYKTVETTATYQEGKFSSNDFLAEELDTFLNYVFNESAQYFQTSSHNKNVVAGIERSVMQGESIVIPIQNAGSETKICISVNDIKQSNELQELNLDMEKSLEKLVYINYSVVNLGNTVIKNPDNFCILDASYKIEKAQVNMSTLEFPDNLEPLQEIKCERIFEIQDDNTLYWINDNFIKFKIKLGGLENE